MTFWKQYGPVILTVAGTISVAVFTPAVIMAHPVAFAAASAVAQLLHAILPSVFAAPPTP